MRLCIHRGSRQIGGNCVEVESQGQRLLIDFGLPLDTDKNPTQYLPEISGLDGNDPTLFGILISHPHIDHCGLLEYISPKIPIGMGAAARRILTAAAPFLPNKMSISKNGWDFQSGQSFDIGRFRITPFLVDHSAYDSYSLMIESDGKIVFYSGDFRAHGRNAKLFDKLVENPPSGIDALIMEGTSVGRQIDGLQALSEKEIESQFMDAFSATEGLAMVQTSAQNIDRLVTIFRASKRTGRKLVIDLYTAAILEATGNANIPQSSWPEVALFIPQSQRVQIKNNAWFDLLKRHASNRIFMKDIQKTPSASTLLFRPLHCSDLDKGKCLDGATYIYSLWEGYWDRGDNERVKNWLEKHSIPKKSIHTSGHASPEDLQQYVNAINPSKVIPIHSFMPESYSELFPNVVLLDDGNWWEV
jgi:ribonuclease J